MSQSSQAVPRALLGSGEPASRRRISRTLFCYCLRDFLLILGCCLAGFLLLFLIGALFDDLEDFIVAGAPTAATARYFVLLQPRHLLDVLPMSLLLAAMYCVGNMSRNNELTAMRGSGISIRQVALPFLVVGAILSAVQLVAGEFVVPAAEREATQLKLRLTQSPKDRSDDLSAHLAFRSTGNNRDWLFRDFQRHGPSRGITVTQFRPDRTTEWQLRAESGVHSDGVWRFTDAVVTRLDASGEFPVGAPERHAVLELELSENPEHIVYFCHLQAAAGISAGQIRNILRAPEVTLSEQSRRILRTSMYYRMFFPLSSLFAVLLGVPLAVTSGRATVMKSVVLAAGVMAVFYVTTQFFVVLGKSGALPAFVAGAVPCLGFTLWGGWELATKR